MFERGHPTQRYSLEWPFVSKSRGLKKITDDAELPDLGLQQLRSNSETVTLTGKQLVELGSESSPEKHRQLSGFCLPIPNGPIYQGPDSGEIPLSQPPPPSPHAPGTGYQLRNTRLYGWDFYLQLRNLEKTVGFLSFQKTISNTFSKYNRAWKVVEIEDIFTPGI